MNFLKIAIILLCCLSATFSPAQKQVIKKANNFYKNNQFKDAIVLYEQALQEKENLGLRTKLSYCYRMTNQMPEAEENYSKVISNEKAKPITYFYFAEALMSNGKYDLAKNWFLKYNEKVPDDENAIRMAYACDKVKTLEPYFPNLDLQTFEHNSEVDEASPVYFNDGIVFTSDRSQGINPLKQKSGWTGRDYQRIYVSTKNPDGTFQTPVNFSKKLNDLNKHCGPVSFSKDKKTVIFSRTSQELGKNNTYNIQLYRAVSEDGSKWKKAELLSFCNKEHNYMHPAISPDGNKLFFISDKPGGIGGTDIYLSTREDDQWSRPQNLGPIINTSSNEAFPFYHETEKIFFSSKGHLSFGGFDILFSHLKEDGSWQKPVNVGQPVNSSYDDISIFIDEDLESGMFASSRDGGDDDIYIFKVTEGINTVLDTIDFEGLTYDEKEKLLKESRTTKAVEEANPSSNLIDSENNETSVSISEKAVTNIEGGIRSEDSLETAREEPSTASQVVAPLNNSKPELTKADNPSNPPKLVVSENEKETNQPQSQSLLIEATRDKINKTKVESEIAAVEPAKEKAKAPKNNSTKSEQIVEQPQQVSLIIPKKEKPVEQVVETTKASLLDDTNKTSKTKDQVLENKASILHKDEIQEPVDETSMPPVSSEGTAKPELEKASILDQSPPEPNPPVLIGDQSSMLSDATFKLPRLAELLNRNAPIPPKGFVVEGVDYPKGSYLLSPESTKSLAVLIDLLNRYPDLKVEIGSHTLALGDDVANHNLSRKRALSIMAFLIYKEISNDRITAKGYGETQLLNQCSNGVDCSKAEHAENDRIEIKVVE